MDLSDFATPLGLAVLFTLEIVHTVVVILIYRNMSPRIHVIETARSARV